MSKVLVIAPHQDDETLAAGCSIYQHYLKGDEITVVFLTDGSFIELGDTPSHVRISISSIWDKITSWYVELREIEALKALSLLGVDGERIFFLGFTDTRLSHFVNDCVSKLLSVVGNNTFTTFYFPSELDSHPDHRAAYRITMLVLMKLLEGSVTQVRRVHIKKYIVWNRSEVETKGILKQTFPEEIVRRKMKAMRAYRTQYNELFRRFETNTEEFIETYISRQQNGAVNARIAATGMPEVNL